MLIQVTVPDEGRIKVEILGEFLMYFIGVLIFINELDSFCAHANLMTANLRVVKKLENVTSDLHFLEECARRGEKGERRRK